MVRQCVQEITPFCMARSFHDMAGSNTPQRKLLIWNSYKDIVKN